jgi:hypothetical protein
MDEGAMSSTMPTVSYPDELTGQCLCGAVRYRCEPPLSPPELCHCTSCRRASGAHALGWIAVKAEGLYFIGARPRLYGSSPGVERGFCGQCGTPLTYQQTRRPREIDLTLGSVDQLDRVAPRDHVWMEDAASWDRPADRLPQHARSRTR